MRRESTVERNKEQSQESWLIRLWKWTGFRAKTLWDWLDLLIVPAVLLLAGFWFAMVQDNRTMDAENRRTQAELRLAEQRAQAEALQAYHDEMATLMLNRNLQDSEQGGPVFTLAQARTTVVMERLDSEDNRSVTRFLTDSSLGRNSKVLYKSSSQRVSTGR